MGAVQGQLGLMAASVGCNRGKQMTIAIVLVSVTVIGTSCCVLHRSFLARPPEQGGTPRVSKLEDNPYLSTLQE